MKKIGMLKRIFGAAIVLVMLGISIIGVIPVSAAPADCYWVGDGGNWSDAATHWAIASGGAPGAGNLPDATSNVHFDANSFTVGGQTVTMDGNYSVKSVDWTGATNNPIWNLGSNKTTNLYGDLTLIGAMTTSSSNSILSIWSSQATTTIISNGTTLTVAAIIMKLSATTNVLSLADNLVSTGQLKLERGILTTNNHDITVVTTVYGTALQLTGWTNVTLNLGSSTINTNGVTIHSGTIVNAGTSTIKVTGTGNFDGAGKTFNDLELNGTAHTISGDNTYNSLTIANTATVTLGSTTSTVVDWDNSAGGTITANTSTIICSGAFDGGGATYNDVELNNTTNTVTGSATYNDLKFSRSGVQTITFTDGTTQTVTSLTRDAGTSIKTLQGSGVGGWTIDNVSGAEIDIDNVDVSYGTVTTDDINAAKLSVNSGNNSGWNFLFTPVTNLATGISMTGFNTTATLNGTISDLGGDYPVTLILEWGYTTAYGNIALNTTTSTVPTSVSATITQFDPEQTVHFRLRAVNGLGTTSGADQTIPFTVPAWYVLIHTLLPVAVAAVILIGVLVVVGNPLAAFLSAMTGLVGYYVILALVSPNWA